MRRDVGSTSTASDVVCWVVQVVFVLGLVVLGVRLADVQVTSSARLRYAGVRQSVRRVETVGVRGRIVDRRGRVLAANRPSVSIVCDPSHYRTGSQAARSGAALAEVRAAARAMGVDETSVTNSIGRRLEQSRSYPFVVWRDVDDEALARFCEHAREYPGLDPVTTDEREYPFGSLAAHVIGYVGRDRGLAVAGDVKFGFKDMEFKGNSGIEFYYDRYLRGVSGERMVLVDAQGYAIREETRAEPHPGLDLELALDIDLQRVVERELDGETGACVVLDPRNGDVLAMASAPTFDLRRCVPVFRRADYDALARDPAHPFLNRASGGSYAPGSTFKPVTALAALSHGQSAARTCDCTGVYEMPGLKLRCSRRWGHGEIDLLEALKFSCNTYFCSLGAEIGTNAVVSAARAFGLGARTGLDLAVDTPGLVPDAVSKRARLGEAWYSGDLVQMSIGQGLLLASPLQMACVAGAIGTGSLVRPHLKRDLAVERRPLPFSRDALHAVRHGMWSVVNGRDERGRLNGTGRRAGESLAVEICGKTGTAEIGSGENRRNNVWFIAYAPARNPTVAVAMVIENGVSGGGTAAPKVRNILAAIFGEKEAAS